MIKIKIDKLVFGGQGIGRLPEGKACFVWNALPGEEAEVELKKNKDNFAEGIAVKILKSAKMRVEPREEHYLSCSPWQILNFADENKWKVEIAKETYKKFGGVENKLLNKLEIVSDVNEYGYRNKMEYSFAERDGEISLAFFEREGRRHIAIPQCELARAEINTVALNLLDWVNANRIPIRSLKTMVVHSNQKGEVLAGLFIKDRLNFVNYPELTNNLIGLTVFYSTHKSPASVPTDILYRIGQDYLEEDLFGTSPHTNFFPDKFGKIMNKEDILDVGKKKNDIGVGVKLCYGLFSFFQINIPIFKQVLADIGKFIENDDVVDYYSGVGTIGLSLQGKCNNLQLVESNQEAVEFAKLNINLNNLTKVEAFCRSAELIVDLIATDKTIIFDPPRAGLDKRVVERVLVVLPKKIIYLSCDLATQARDLGLLQKKYRIKFLKLYNFFPRTAHIEGLSVLELK